MRDSNPSDLSGKQEPQSSVPSKTVTFLSVEIALLFFGGWAYWPALQEIFGAWNSNPDYSHGFLVVPIALAFLWARRDLMPSGKRPSFSWQGLVLLVLAGVLRLLAGRLYLPELEGWSIPLWLAGIVWLFHGRSLLLWALPSLAFLWFATPLPGSFETLLSTPLQHLAAQLGSWTLRLTGQAAIAEGTTILLNEHVLDIERACSGLRMFYGIFALAVAGVIFSRLRGWGAFAILVAAIPVAIVANVFRIAVTGILLQKVSGEAARKFSHDFAGLVMIPLAVLLFGLLVIGIRSGIDRFHKNQADGMSWLIRWGTCCLVVVGALFWWGNYQRRHVLAALLETANRYEQEQNWSWSATYLQRYLQANPADRQVTERFAEVYAKAASSRRDQVRSIAFSHRAWKKNPNRTDLALIAARRAFEIGETRRSLQICEELLATKNAEKNRCEIQCLRADALLAYLGEKAVAHEFSSEDLARVLEATRECATDEIRYQVELAKLWQEKLLKPDQESRTKIAYEIMAELVASHAENPMAWLARHQFSIDYRSLQDQVASEQAEQDLQQALALVEQATEREKTSLFLAAASHAQSLNDWDKAERYLKLAIAATPANPRPVVVLAELKRAQGDSESLLEAIELLRESLRNVGDQDVRLLLPLASLQTEIGEWDAAAESLGAVEAMISALTGPRQSQVRMGFGLVRTQILWHREGAYPAIRWLESVVNDEQVRLSRPHFPQLFAQSHILRGKLYRSVGMVDRASDQFRAALQLDPNSEGIRLEVVDSALKAGDLESAEHHCRQLLRESASLPEAWVAMIRIHVRRQLRQPPAARDWSLAQRAFDEARDHKITRTDLLLAEVEMLEAQGKSNSAEQLLRLAIEQAPQDPMLWRELALLSDHQGEWDRGLESVEKYLDRSPQEIAPYVLKATLLEKANRSQEAQEVLAALLERSSGRRWVIAAQELARLQLLLGKVSDAKTLLEEAHRKEPANLMVLSTLANLAWVTGDWGALEQYETWLYEVEGEAGTLWRFHRAQRLLEDAESSEDPTFEEVWRLSQTLQDLRPRWSKTSLLLGDIALRSGQINAAIGAFQRAWNLGDRSALLADRLIDLLTKRGRASEAHSYVTQVRSALSLSSRLLDRAIPYYVEGGEPAIALKLAEAWIARRPEDAAAHLRLGRVLHSMASSAEENAKQDQYRERAKAAFLQALQKAPQDVSVWIANVVFAMQHEGDQASVDPLLAGLGRQVKLDESSLAFVLAQVNEALDRPSQAQSQYRLAINLAKRPEERTSSTEVLGKASLFYLDRVPFLAERYAREALAMDADAAVPKQVLLKVLAQSSEAKDIDEALTLLESNSVRGPAWNVDFRRRMRAKLLHRQGESGGATDAIHLLETLLQKTTDDKRLLASLYEQKNRLGPAFEILSQLANLTDASLQDKAAFLLFWQRHFLAKAIGQQRPKFLSQAQRVYDQLRQVPVQQVEWLRLKARELRLRQEAEPLSREDVDALVAELVVVNRNFVHWSGGAQLAWCRSMLQMLIEEDLLTSALQFVKEPPAGMLDVDLAIALCHAMILSSKSTVSHQTVNTFLQKFRANHSQRAELARAIGDYQFMTGQYELAVEAYRGALAIEPNHKLAKNNLALSLAELPGKLTEAQSVLHEAILHEALLHEAMEESGSDPMLLDTQAVLDLIDHRASDAIETLEQVLSASPENATARIHVAMGYQALGEPDSMRTALLDAMVLGIHQALLSPRDRAFYEKMSQQGNFSKPSEEARSLTDAATKGKNAMVLSP